MMRIELTCSDVGRTPAGQVNAKVAFVGHFFVACCYNLGIIDVGTFVLLWSGSWHSVLCGVRVALLACKLAFFPTHKNAQSGLPHARIGKVNSRIGNKNKQKREHAAQVDVQITVQEAEFGTPTQPELMFPFVFASPVGKPQNEARQQKEQKCKGGAGHNLSSGIAVAKVKPAMQPHEGGKESGNARALLAQKLTSLAVEKSNNGRFSSFASAYFDVAFVVLRNKNACWRCRIILSISFHHFSNLVGIKPNLFRAYIVATNRNVFHLGFKYVQRSRKANEADNTAQNKAQPQMKQVQNVFYEIFFRAFFSV